MSFPTVREAFFVILATLFFLFSLDLGIPEGAGKTKLLLLEAFVAVPAVIFTGIRRYNFKEIFRWKKTDVRLLLVSVLIGAGLHAPIDLLDGFVQKILPMPEFLAEALTDLLRIGNTRELIIVVLAGVAAAGLTEEMVFRGFFQTTMERNHETTRAVMLTAFLFAFSHFHPWWFPGILILGVLLGVLSWRSGNIFPCVAVHCTYNAISIGMINTAPEKLGWYLAGEHVSPVWAAAGVLMVMAGFRVFYKLTEAKSG